MKPGTKPKPTALKELAGNPGKRPLPEAEPRPRGPMPSMPAERLEDLEQLTWVQLRGALEPLGLLTDADPRSFELMVRHFAEAVRHHRIVSFSGRVLFGEKGEYRNPADVAFIQHSRAYLRYAVEFGLTPSSRTTLQTALPGEKEKSLADLLFEGTEAATGGKFRTSPLVRVVGARAAKALKGAGLGTLELAAMAVQEGMDLSSIPGVGPATVRKLEGSQ